MLHDCRATWFQTSNFSQTLITRAELDVFFFLLERLIFGLRLNVLKYFEDFSLKCS